MLTHDRGTVAALQFNQCPPLKFEDIVKEFDSSFRSGAFQLRRLTWDCDDIAILDHGPVRIALGWIAPQNHNQSWYLVVAIGSSPEAANNPLDREACRALADRILQRIELSLPTEGVFRSEIDKPVDAALINAVCEHLQDGGASDQQAKAKAKAIAQAKAARARAKVKAINFNENPSKLKASWASRSLEHRQGSKAEVDDAEETERIDADDARLQKLRKVLSEVCDQQPISLPMHLTLYTFSLSMLLQVPPVGAAMLVYNILREDFLPFS